MQGDFGAGLAGTAQNTGQNAINAFNPQDTAGTQRQGFTSLLGSQMGSGGPTSSQDYFNKYSSTLAGMPSMPQAYQTANDIYNVPGLQKQANYLNQQVANVAPNQYNLARGFDVGDAQVQNAINTNLRFLQPQAAAATQNAQTAQGLAQGYVGQQQAQNQFMAQPVQQQGQMLSDALARQSSGYDIAAQNELQGLVAKMQSGVTLSDQEMTRANQLLSQQNAYQQTLQGQKYQTVGQNQNLINTFTGSILNPTIANPTGMRVIS